ncbi:hypothetical protein N4G69_20200 [Streptomyces mirabilis]|uniref:hypothetical protein n=1 Tax=Streptomyces mirabilis TaxID=68239 RepID=UPI0021BF429A|nr:hypothetical protein [Streptomyces mirabilis]MCT9107928.1 hypothetical protein [Streptomyces mirabilis]
MSKDHMPEDNRPAFGITAEGTVPEGFLSKPTAEWYGSELEAGIAQIGARLRKHPEYATQLTRLRDCLIDEQDRRHLLFEEVAAVFIDSQEGPSCPE